MANKESGDNQADKQPNSNRAAHLLPYQWQKGQSGNPKGRPTTEYSVTSQAKLLIDAEPRIVKQIAAKWLKQAMKGEVEARRDFQDRTEGTAPKIVKIGGIDGGEAIRVIGVQVTGLDKKNKD